MEATIHGAGLRGSFRVATRGNAGAGSSGPEQLEQSKLSEQVAAYNEIKRDYDDLAIALVSGLQTLVHAEFPYALVRARAKTVAGFAEKQVMRTYERPLEEFGDLCGVRVIVHSNDQVRAVEKLLVQVFTVHKREDKSAGRAVDKFGYRDLHLNGWLSYEQCLGLGFDQSQAERFQGRKIELQIRTWLQHAYAEIVHDRVYKTPLKPSSEDVRRFSALAALVEEGDEVVNDVTSRLDLQAASYTETASQDEITEVIERRLLVAGVTGMQDPHQVVALARLQRTIGQLDSAIDTLREAQDDPLVASELGHLLCLQAWDEPYDPQFQEGLELLAQRPARQLVTVRARAAEARRKSRYGWALAQVGERGRAHQELLDALDIDPDHPYLLADAITLGFASGERTSLDPLIRRQIARSSTACARQAEAGIELPRSHFTAGRLALLGGQRLTALSHICRGLSMLRDDDGRHRWERDWPSLVDSCPDIRPDLQWLRALLVLADTPEPDDPVRAVVTGESMAPVGRSLGARELPSIDVPDPENPEAGDVWKAVENVGKAGLRGSHTLLVSEKGGHALYARIVLGLGGKAAVRPPNGRAGVAVDPVWRGFRAVIPTPDDDATIRQLLSLPTSTLTTAQIDQMAEHLHTSYLVQNPPDSPPQRQPWDNLEETFRQDNRDQATGIAPVLALAGYEAVSILDPGESVTEFTEEETEQLAEIEHGRWSASKLQNGWRYSPERDDSHQLHDDLVPWQNLAESDKEYDRNAVRQFPAVLFAAGLKVKRR